MRITKFGHACVRISAAGADLVVDPGIFSQPDAVDGATAVLVTHEHPDHFHLDHLRRTPAPVFTVAAVAAQIAEQAPDVAERVHVVAPGREVPVEGADGGPRVTAVGEVHAVIHPELPRVHNSGYLIEAEGVRLYHPGDALTGPGVDIDVLCVPVSAPWLKVSEAIDFARSVGAPHNLAIHDRVYSAAGLTIVDGHLERFLGPAGQRYARIADGTDLALG